MGGVVSGTDSRFFAHDWASNSGDVCLCSVRHGAECGIGVCGRRAVVVYVVADGVSDYSQTCVGGAIAAAGGARGAVGTEGDSRADLGVDFSEYLWAGPAGGGIGDRDSVWSDCVQGAFGDFG